MRISKNPRLAQGLLATVAPWTLILGGCTEHSNPSYPLFGAYFPSWLISAVLGILAALALRAVFVRVGVDDVLPWRLPIYASMAAAIACVWTLTVYGR
jgi:uncharacterized membrane protein